MDLLFSNLKGYNVATKGLLDKHPNATLLTATELYEWINPLKVLPARASISESFLDKRVRKYKENRELIHAYVSNLGPDFCTGINPKYALSSIDNIQTYPEDFDALFLVNDITKPLLKRNQAIDDMIDELQSRIMAFVIVELGECKMKPDVISINLICTNGTGGVGQLILGAVLYCIGSQTELEKECVLELAKGYQNISGFLTYSKLGFVPNLDLFKPRYCFGAKTNLPMSVDLTHHTPDAILGYVTKTRPLDIQDPTFRILSLKSDPTKKNVEELKNKYIAYQNLLMKSKFQQASELTTFILKITTEELSQYNELGLINDKLEKDVGKYKYIDDMDKLFMEEIQLLQEELLELPHQLHANVTVLPDGKFKVCTGSVCEIIEADALVTYLTTLRGGKRKKELRKTKKNKKLGKYI